MNITITFSPTKRGDPERVDGIIGTFEAPERLPCVQDVLLTNQPSILFTSWLRSRLAPFVQWALLCVLVGCNTAIADDLPKSVKILVRNPLVAAKTPSFDETVEPGSRGAKKNLEMLERIRGKLKSTRYQHRTVVKERAGKYFWDCSGMTSWILKRSSPRALRAIKRERAVARDFYKAIERAPTKGYRKGWKRLTHIKDARPGDIFAWLRPPDWPRRNTGHVGFVLAPPVPVPNIPNAYAVRIADATSVAHQDDTRKDLPDGGYGEGTLLWTTDGEGNGLAYGWHGTRSRAVVTTPPLFGRVR